MRAFVRSTENSLLSDAFGGILSLSVRPGRESDEAQHTVSAHPLSFQITTKVRSGSSANNGGPKILSYEVVRSLNELGTFCEQFRRREPFSLVGELPRGTGGVLNGRDRRRHEVFNDCDYILCVLLFMVSSERTNNDPLLWSLLTTPAEEYKVQFEAMSIVPTTGRQLDKLEESRLYQLRVDGGLKPETLSPKMIQSGMADRAFFSCDKFNNFLEALGGLETIRDKQANARIRHWDAALQAAANLHQSSVLLGSCQRQFSHVMRKATTTNFWPWRHLNSETNEPNPDTVGSSLSRWMLRLANVSESSATTIQNTLTADIVQDLVIQCLYNNALEASTLCAEVTLMTNNEMSRPVGESQCVESKLLNILENGDGGIDSLDALEQVDEEISVLHDSVDGYNRTFLNHFEEIERSNNTRLHQHLQELVLQQKLQWDLFIMTMKDLQNSIENDEFPIEADDLPIFSKTVEPRPPGDQQPSTTALPPLVSPAIAATSKAPSSPTTIKQNVRASAFDPIGTLFSKPPTERRKVQSQPRDEDAFGNPFDVPGGDENEEEEEMTVLSKPSWRELYEHDRHNRSRKTFASDDPFASIQ